MRLAIVVGRLAKRDEMCPSYLDLERCLSALQTGVELEAFIDEPSPASQALSDAGVPVTVSPRRWVLDSTQALRSADQLMAEIVLRKHRKEEFDALIYGGDLNVDLAWHEPALGHVPRGVALDDAIFAVPGRPQNWLSDWSRSGLIASADFVVAADHPNRASAVLPNGPPLWQLPAPTPQASNAQPSDGRERNEASNNGWLVVSAHYEPEHHLPRLLRHLLTWEETKDFDAFVVLVKSPASQGHILEAIGRTLDAELAHKVLLVPSNQAAAADQFLASCDGLLLAQDDEFSVPAVASRAAELARARLPAVWCRTPFGDLERCSRLRHGRAAEISRVPRLKRRAEPTLIWEDATTRPYGPAENHQASTEMVLLAQDTKQPPASALQLRLPEGVDLVLWAQPDAMFGSAIAHSVDPTIIGVRFDLLKRVADQTAEPLSPWQVMTTLIRPARVGSYNLLVLPGDRQGTYRHLSTDAGGVFPLDGSQGLFAHSAIDSFHRFAVDEVTSPSAAPSLPVLHAKSGGSPRSALLHWARSNSWANRARLAAPWRFGVLERLMSKHWSSS